MLLFLRRKHRPSDGELPNPHYHPATGHSALGLEKSSQKLLRANGAHPLLIYPGKEETLHRRKTFYRGRMQNVLEKEDYWRQAVSNFPGDLGVVGDK